LFQPGGYAGNQKDAYERRLRASDKDERATNAAQGHAPMVLGEVHLRGESNQGLRNRVAVHQHGLFGNPKVGLLVFFIKKTSKHGRKLFNLSIFGHDTKTKRSHSVMFIHFNQNFSDL
jgi:hypothetical protein